LILPDEMRLVSGDALGEHGDRGVSRSVHNDLLSGPQPMPRLALLQYPEGGIKYPIWFPNSAFFKQSVEREHPGDDPTATAITSMSRRRHKREGDTSSDVAVLVVLAGAECEYQLGATQKHPPTFRDPR
jgi:hypothetical protein